MGRHVVSAAARCYDAGPQWPATSLEESLEDVVTQRPLATIALALGIGFLSSARPGAPLNAERRWRVLRPTNALASMAALARAPFVSLGECVFIRIKAGRGFSDGSMISRSRCWLRPPCV
jgi:hypothetical protein